MQGSLYLQVEDDDIGEEDVRAEREDDSAEAEDEAEANSEQEEEEEAAADSDEQMWHSDKSDTCVVFQNIQFL